MIDIFVNLKRFDVPRSMGGICSYDNPKKWIEWVMNESVKYGLGKLKDLNVTYLLPEGLIISAIDTLKGYQASETRSLQIGCQGVFRENITPGRNFGAFTTNLPAAAARNLGCTWSIIGHSEERKDKLGIIEAYDSDFHNREKARSRATCAVNSFINREVLCALDAELNVLLCVGETSEERGNGTFDEQKPRIKAVLKTQLEIGLESIKERMNNRRIVIGYEPIWAIGPGKTPPGAGYIEFVSSSIKTIVIDMFDFDPVVVYGGGLKEENARMIADIETIDGGLVALTQFTGEIAFEPESLKNIIYKYSG